MLCSGCFNGSGGSAMGYMLATLVMMAVPFGMVGALGAVLYRGSAPDPADEADARAHAP